MEESDSQEESKRPRSKWKLILLVIASPFLLGLLCLGFSAVAVYSEKALPITAADKGVVVRADDLETVVPDFQATPLNSTFTKIRDVFGTYTLDSTYEEDALFFTFVVDIERKRSDALATYQIQKLAYKLGFQLDEDSDKFAYAPSNDLAWGDRSDYVVITYDGEPVGHAFVALKGKRIVYFLLTGRLLDRAQIRALVLPKLKALDAYTP